MVAVSGLHPVLPAHNAIYVILMHQMGHAQTRSSDALVTELKTNVGRAIATLTLLIDLLNLFDELPLFVLPEPYMVFKPVVKSADAYLLHPTHLLYGILVPMLLYESVYRPSPLEKMLMAFFRMSRSRCASFSSLCNLLISF
jgi:hypothetical protein